MQKIILFVFPLTILVIVSFYFRPVSGSLAQQPMQLPAFSTDPNNWLNSAPINANDIKDKVVLLDFWTFDCWNCYRSFPWLNDLYTRFKDNGLLVIGIHTPEFSHEKNRENVMAKIREFELHHPVMLDNDYKYWNAMKNRYWPAYYIVDKKNMVRARYYGETHKNDSNARQIESLLIELLNE